MGYDSNDFDDGSIERCPHCNGSGNVRAYDPPFTTGTYYYVVCEDCGAMTSPTAKTPAEAVVKWNRRTGWDDYAGNPDYDPRREDHRGGLQPSSIIRNLRECGDGDCRGCSLIILRYAGCQNRLMLAAADTIEHLMERERRRKQT
ncbi:MAG: Lar family restriction alleviation protein [Kiritimatiellae bacterium]|nr:Lar family restriction alleviation protein [Kiritimatiellia bacterium]MBQ4458558.1 Lar family restriction alleviation protein [Clostridia bacterium]